MITILYQIFFYMNMYNYSSMYRYLNGQLINIRFNNFVSEQARRPSRLIHDTGHVMVYQIKNSTELPQIEFIFSWAV